MSRLDPAKLHVRFQGQALPEGPLFPRRYTLTHSDVTGDLFLGVGTDYDRRAINGWYTRLMRDEVLAEWLEGDSSPALHIYCHVSGGLAFGLAAWRDGILRYHMALVLQAFRYGDRALFAAQPQLDQAQVLVHFRSSRARFHRLESWGALVDYRVDGG
jgi:hypothetical protein